MFASGQACNLREDKTLLCGLKNYKKKGRENPTNSIPYGRDEKSTSQERVNQGFLSFSRGVF